MVKKYDNYNYKDGVKMKKALLMLALASSFALVFSGCSSDNTDEVDKDIVSNGQVEQAEGKDKDVEEEEVNSDETLEEAYQRILDEYTIKLQEATPGVIADYKEEAKENNDGLEGLAELSNAKITILAEISNEGVVEMAEVMMTKGSGSYDEYEGWAQKLMDVYMEEASKVTDAYMDSAM